MVREAIKNKKTIAAFDFDGTITKYDTLPYFIYFALSYPKLIASTLKMLPSLVLFKLKVITNNVAKEKLFRIFFKGFSEEKFKFIANHFTHNIAKIVRTEAIEKIKWHQKMGHEVIIISASVEIWIKPWAMDQGIETVLGTKLETINGKLTGNFTTNNCYGQEKVNRLLENYPNRETYTLYAYGDSNGDKNLLELADHAFYRTF